MLFFLILVLAIVFCFWFFIVRKSKIIKTGSLSLVTGGVKAGKSTVAVAMAIREYKSVLFGWYIARFFCKLFHKPVPEKPLLYSNVPLKVKYGYVPLTEDLITRDKRFRYRSIIYVNEASLLHDKDIYRNSNYIQNLDVFKTNGTFD